MISRVLVSMTQLHTQRQLLHGLKMRVRRAVASAPKTPRVVTCGGAPQVGCMGRYSETHIRKECVCVWGGGGGGGGGKKKQYKKAGLCTSVL